MATRDLRSRISPAQSLRPAARTATANGTGVDLRGFESAAVLIDLGTFAGTTPSATFKIQDSDDNSTFADVDAAFLQGGALPTIDTTSHEQVLERGYIGTKRYLRVIISAISGTSPSLPCAAVVVRGHPHIAPS